MWPDRRKGKDALMFLCVKQGARVQDNSTRSLNSQVFYPVLAAGAWGMMGAGWQEKGSCIRSETYIHNSQGSSWQNTGLTGAASGKIVNHAEETLSHMWQVLSELVWTIRCGDKMIHDTLLITYHSILVPPGSRRQLWECCTWGLIILFLLTD